MKAIIMTFFISMVPVIELRGGIPAGVAQGLDPVEAMIVSIAGNMVPVPFIILFIRSIFHFLRGKSRGLDLFMNRYEKRAESKADNIRRYSLWGLFMLVAIPLPGTGAWTGSFVAAMLDIRLKAAIPVIFAGLVCAGIIISLITYGIIRL